ncbi:peptide MFS transporter [Clostridium botulinum]|uniref:MFS transporter n=2 Tax=Clostridium botulinum TaxID=1491 RepID=A0A846HX03_CLOBO|nr:peptide MFS transporter [Clostridium botulinum]ACQ54958.1 amino acid/peptide transporter [Clostridium botulinum Ba4 str. 657]AJE10789.1 amino acid/peptide transporter family protein [Clostridium botulinum CDC_1436]APR02023.1 amino acid/peptide transporter family protein [Clostridium botulinum]APU61151.1 amino acid/peptide transporter family protein [Clostridium botulinum]AUN03753.1 MFS transporter [Clostridium botulinum]
MSQEKQKHPIGLSLVNISIALQSYAGYAVSSVLILFFTADINRNGLGLSVPKAASIIGLYQGVNYMGSLVGGYITDKWLGIQKSLMLGSFLTACGYMVLFFAKPNIGSIWLGLIVLIIAGAFFKGQISTLVGSLYGKNELSKKDAAYSIFYMFINIGSFFGPIIAGLISDKWFAKVAADGEIAAYGYKYIFLMCAIVMIIVCALILVLSPKWLGDVGKYPASKTEAKKASLKSEEEVTNKPLTHTEKNRIKAMIVMFLFVIIFWSAWYQTATSFSLLADKLVNRKFGGFIMPVPWLTSVNAIFCVVFSPILANIWVKLGNSKKGDLSVPTKMGLGLILAGASFITLILGISTLGGVTDGSRQMNILFIIVAYFLLTLGELCLSPIGMAMFNKLAPAKFGSLAMGAWYLSFFFSNLISGKLAGFTDTMGYTEIFGFIAGVVIIFGLILILLRKGLLKLMSLDEFNK